MKRFISALLVVCMLGSVLLSIAGCSLFAKRIDAGTEAAKLLLANERLDETLVGEKIDLGLSATQQRMRAKMPKKARGLPEKQLANSGSGYTWTEFPNKSHSFVEFNQFMKGVEEEVQDVAEDIAHMKNNVGVTDKWVKIGLEKQMLRVYENYDVLIVVGEYEDLHIYYRYTDENAKNVYEMFSLMSYDDGTTGEIRTMLIPGERYEYMYNNSNGFTDYFIAENTRGYWLNTRFNYHHGENGYKSISFSPYIVRDGLGYGAFLTADSVKPALDNAWYSVFDPGAERELFRINDGYGDYHFNLYMTAIRDGFVSVSSKDARFDAEEGIYDTAHLDTLTTQNGVYTAISDDNQLPEDAFAFIDGYVQYIYGDEIYYGSLDFAMMDTKMSIADACQEFGSYAGTLGLRLYCDMETVATSLDHASLLAENFSDSFFWNGYKMDSIENMEKARAVLQAQFDSARAAYEEVKNFETSNERQRLSSSAHFAQLDAAAAGNNSFAGKIIKLSGVTVSTNDIVLFEDGKEYVLKVGLSLLDESSNPISVNTVPLSGTEPVSVRFAGNSITLAASGEYEIPMNLHQGQYAAVVYVATKDEGIRVSEIQKVAFVSIQNGEIENSAMYLEASENNKNLILKYQIKNIRYVTVEASKEAYTYDEIQRLLNLEILAYGAPFHGAVLEYENGEAVAEGATLGKGTYRLMCYLATEDGIAQSYTYLQIV